MLFHSWLCARRSGPESHRVNHKRQAERRGSGDLRPALELLEDRTLPTAVTVLGSHLVTAGGLAQPAFVSGVNVAVNGRDVSFDAPPGTYNLQTDLSQSYGSFTVSSASTISGTTGALVASGNQINFDLTKLAAVTVTASDLVTPGGLAQFLKVFEVANFTPGRDDTVYVGAGSYGLTTPVNQSYGGFTISVNGSGALAVSGTSGGAVASGNRIDFDLTKLAAIRVAASDLVTPGGLVQGLKVYEVVNFGVAGRDDTVYVGAGTYGLETALNQVYGSFTVSVTGSGTLAVTATSGAAVATTTSRVDIQPCDLNRVQITPNVGISWNANNVANRGSSAPDIVAFPDGSYTLTLSGPSGFTSATFSVSSSSGLSATQLPQGSPLVTLALVPCAPVVGPITAPVTPVPVNTAVAASAPFTDPGLLDTHTAVWNWGDGSTSAGAVTESNGAGSVSGSHSYTVDGVYTLTLTVTDDGGASGQSTFSYLVVYNPSAGFVTGGGWFNSPAGAYLANPTLTGKANFGFNAKYHPNSTVPEGDTEFQFSAANLKFHTTSYDWLVITGAQAQYQGSGTINGAGNYGFFVTALDGKQPGGDGVDKFRIKIWDKNNNNTVIYDTQQGAAITAPPTTPLGGGNITVHSNGNSPPPPGGSSNGGANKEPLTPLLLDGLFAAGLRRQTSLGSPQAPQLQVSTPSPMPIILTAREGRTCSRSSSPWLPPADCTRRFGRMGWVAGWRIPRNTPSRTTWSVTGFIEALKERGDSPPMASTDCPAGP